MQRRRTSAVTVALLVGVALAGCTDATEDETPDAVATPVPGATATATPAQDTGDQADAADAADTAGDDAVAAEPSPASTPSAAPTPVPDGDGCTPGNSDTLPDGEWFGFLVEAGEDDLEFDLACWFTGEDAELAAAARGEDEVPNDYLITNDNPALRTLPAATDLMVERLTEGVESETVPLEDYLDGEGFYADICPGPECPVWITVGGGVVTEMAEQYRP